jgi:hypothetical protein
MDDIDASQRPDIRFGSNEVSRETLQSFSKLTDEISKDNPWFIGNTITGSMVIGTAHRRDLDQDHSDIDAHWFYDSSKMDMQVVADNAPPGDLKYNPDEEDQKHLAAMYKIRGEVTSLYPKFFDTQTADLEETFKDLYQSPDPLAFVHDVNKDFLQKAIHKIGDTAVFNTLDMSDSSIREIKFLFLARLNEVGVSQSDNRLDTYRRFVLDELQTTKHGEEMLRIIMDEVGRMERPEEFGRLPFTHYPPTIDDARQFFHLTDDEKKLE